MHWYLENGTRYKQLLLMTNRKLHMHFSLAPRSMTLKCRKFKFSCNFPVLRILGGNNGWMNEDKTRSVNDGIVAHLNYFSTMYRLILLGLGVPPQGCRALTFALSRPSCLAWQGPCDWVDVNDNSSSTVKYNFTAVTEENLAYKMSWSNNS